MVETYTSIPTLRTTSLMKPTRSVPVTRRLADEARRPAGTTEAGRSRSRGSAGQGAGVKLTPGHWVIVILTVIIVLFAIAIPLKNYFQQRGEIARLETSIAAKEQRQRDIVAEIDKYSNDAYKDELARNRFGTTKPGELAYRINDPRMTDNNSLTSVAEDLIVEYPWYEELWRSVTVPADPEAMEGPRDVAQ